MTECLAPPRRPIVNVCAHLRAPTARHRAIFSLGPHANRSSRPIRCDADDQDDFDREDLGMPLPDDNDPDWGFDDEEAQPEHGDFWLDSHDEEDAL